MSPSEYSADSDSVFSALLAESDSSVEVAEKMAAGLVGKVRMEWRGTVPSNVVSHEKRPSVANTFSTITRRSLSPRFVSFVSVASFGYFLFHHSLQY